MAELDIRTAQEQAREMHAYVDSFNGQTFSPALDSVDRQNLATALDNLLETAAMLGNVSDRLVEQVKPEGLVINATQLRSALEFVAPDFETDEDQREQEVVIQRLPARTSTEGEPMEAGMYCWLADYPEEGCIPLREDEQFTPLASHTGEAEPTDGQIIDWANEALPGWTRRDNDLAYIKVVRAALASRKETRAIPPAATPAAPGEVMDELLAFVKKIANGEVQDHMFSSLADEASSLCFKATALLALARKS